MLLTWKRMQAGRYVAYQKSDNVLLATREFVAKYEHNLDCWSTYDNGVEFGRYPLLKDAKAAVEIRLSQPPHINQ